MADHRKPPRPLHYDSPKGKCRWCGKDILKDDLSINNRANWHKECVLEYKLLYWPKITRKAVYKRDKGICAKCGHKCARKHEDVWHLDHIKPLIESNGDINFWKLTNIQTLCQSCHKEKTSREATERAAKRRKEK